MRDAELAEVVRRLRDTAGLTQHELATRAGMAQSAVSDYERGRKVPSIATLRRLAEAVGATLDIDLGVEVGAGTGRPPASLAELRRVRREIRSICRRHGARRPRVVGSVARGEATEASDVDLLVDLDRGRTLFDVAALHDDLVDLLQRDVDVITSGAVRGRLAALEGEAVEL